MRDGAIDVGSERARADSSLELIHWWRMPKPQSDGYDTEMLKLLAGREYSFDRYIKEGEPVWFGSVPIRPYPFVQGALIPGPLDHPTLPKTEKLIQEAWPEMYDQCCG